MMIIRWCGVVMISIARCSSITAKPSSRQPIMSIINGLQLEYVANHIIILMLISISYTIHVSEGRSFIFCTITALPNVLGREVSGGTVLCGGKFPGREMRTISSPHLEMMGWWWCTSTTTTIIVADSFHQGKLRMINSCKLLIPGTGPHLIIIHEMQQIRATSEAMLRIWPVS